MPTNVKLWVGPWVKEKTKWTKEAGRFNLKVLADSNPNRAVRCAIYFDDLRLAWDVAPDLEAGAKWCDTFMLEVLQGALEHYKLRS